MTVINLADEKAKRIKRFEEAALRAIAEIDGQAGGYFRRKLEQAFVEGAKWADSNPSLTVDARQP